jgi:hypothetical protein
MMQEKHMLFCNPAEIVGFLNTTNETESLTELRLKKV